MKREAQRQREEAARVTKNGLDCSVLADCIHLPIMWPFEPQLTTPKEDLEAQGTHFSQPKVNSHSQHDIASYTAKTHQLVCWQASISVNWAVGGVCNGSRKA